MPALQFFVSSADDTVGSNGDFGLVLSTRTYIGPKAGNSWSGVAQYSSIGPSGPSFIYGKGAPASSVGSDGQVYVDQLTFNAYGPKTSGAWGSVTKALVGPQGIQGLQGAASTVPGPKGDTGAASTVPGPKGDTGAASTVAGPKGDTGAKGDQGIQGTQGIQGIAGTAGTTGSMGLSVLSGGGAPASTLGATGQPAYIDTTAWAGYAAKTSSGWPTTSTSLIGPQGIQGVAGPAGAIVYSGSGAPTTANTAAQVTAGSFYIRTDTTPYYLYGPYTAANGWPTTYVPMGGGSFQITNGPPASSLGAAGDIAIDLQNALFYPPKQAAGWTLTPINMVGPTGAQGSSGGAATTVMGAFVGPSAAITTATTASSAPIVLTQPNSTTIASYTPSTQSYLLGGSYAVQSGTSLVLELYDQTAGVSLYKTSAFNAGSIFPLGPFPAASAALGGIPLTANNTVVWRITGSGSAVVQIDPIYYDTVAVPALPLGVSTWSGFSAVAAQTSSSVVTKMLGNASYPRFVRVAKTAYLHQVTITNAGTSGTVSALFGTVNSSNALAATLTNIIDASGAQRVVAAGETWTSPVYGTQFAIGLNVNYSFFTSGTSTGPVTISCKITQ